MRARVVVAEDDRKQAEIVRLYLERAGFDVVVAHSGTAALEAIRERRPDLVVLDWMMPGLDGPDVLRILRYEDDDVPVIFLTARVDEDDLLAALDLGADDYLTKPYSHRELVARARRAVKRHAARGDDGDATIVIGTLEVDRRRHEVRRDGHAIAVTPKEFAVLSAMAGERGRAFSRRQLLEAAFGFDYEGLERTVDVHVLNLRKKIERDPSEPVFVQTVYGVGYRVPEDQDLPAPTTE